MQRVPRLGSQAGGAGRERLDTGCTDQDRLSISSCCLVDCRVQRALKLTFCWRSRPCGSHARSHPRVRSTVRHGRNWWALWKPLPSSKRAVLGYQPHAKPHPSRDGRTGDADADAGVYAQQRRAGSDGRETGARWARRSPGSAGAADVASAPFDLGTGACGPTSPRRARSAAPTANAAGLPRNPGRSGDCVRMPIAQFPGLNDSDFHGFVFPRSPGSDGRETAE